MNIRYLLVVISALMSLAVSVGAANDSLSGYCGRQRALNVDSTNLSWRVDTAQHKLVITGSGPMKDYNMDTKAPWYDWRDKIESVSFPNGMTTVGEYAMYQCNWLKRVDFPESVLEIKNSAFYSCSHIEEIDFGTCPAVIGGSAFSPANDLVTIKAKKIKSIGSNAFSNCGKLVNLQLGDALQSIGYSSFYGCNVLKEIHFPATLTGLANTSFEYAYVLESITVDEANTVFDSRNNCNAVIRKSDNTLVLGCYTTVIPAEVKTIGANAFYTCKKLTGIDLPAGLKTIESYAFYGCDKLQTMVLPEGLQTLDSYAFSSCSQLQSINFPISIQSVGCAVFRNCQSLTAPVYNANWFAYLPAKYEGDYTIPSTIRNIACEAFYGCSKMTGVDIPERVQAIANNTFSGCQSLKAVDIPDSVTSIGQYAFQNCYAMKAITFPANLSSFGGNMFYGCNKLSTIVWNVRKYDNFNVSATWSDPFNGIRNQITSFTFGDSVHVIPANLCYNMDRLSSLSLGFNIQTIGDNAFEGCLNIKSLFWNLRTCADPDIYTQAPFYPIHDSIRTFVFGDSVQHIPAYLCHSMSRLHEVHIPKKVSSIGRYAFRYLGVLDSISVDEDNSHYDSREDCNALIETGSDVLLLGCYKTVIPDDITGIGECAFRNVRNLKSVILSDNVQFIGKEAFNGCHEMEELRLPELTTIEDYTFQDCDSLRTVTIPQSVENIGFRAFAHCSGLEDINCQAVNPPTIDATSFSGTTCPIHVPCAGIADYRSAPVWSDFGSRLTGEALYTLTVQPNEFAYGTVSILQKPDCERNAIIEATPSRGYAFMYWKTEGGTVLSTSAHYEFAVEEDMRLTAVFERKTEGLEAIQADGTAVWYDVMGRRVSEPTTGVYIVVIGNETYKVQR